MVDSNELRGLIDAFSDAWETAQKAAVDLSYRLMAARDDGIKYTPVRPLCTTCFTPIGGLIFYQGGNTDKPVHSTCLTVTRLAPCAHCGKVS